MTSGTDEMVGSASAGPKRVDHGVGIRREGFVGCEIRQPEVLAAHEHPVGDHRNRVPVDAGLEQPRLAAFAIHQWTEIPGVDLGVQRGFALASGVVEQRHGSAVVQGEARDGLAEVPLPMLRHRDLFVVADRLEERDPDADGEEEGGGDGEEVRKVDSPRGALVLGRHRESLFPGGFVAIDAGEGGVDQCVR